ncbi:MAG: hypothetical protein ACXVHB_25370 [Solirubrobacteraceae bacterium]
MCTVWRGRDGEGTIHLAMDTDRARLISERLQAGDREEDGTPLLQHIRRVAHEVPAEAQTVAWPHEALDWTAVAEQELLANGLESDELRALRLLHRTHDSPSTATYPALLTAANGLATEAGAGYGAPGAPAARSRMPSQSIKSTSRNEAT